MARGGAWVVGFVTYEAAPAFDPALATLPRGRLPLAWFGVFPAGAAASSPAPAWEGGTAAPIAPRTSVGDARYLADVARIREYIAAGDSYQVNYTLPFEVPAPSDPVALYERLRLAQAGAYSACIVAEDFAILSASPELFFQRRGAEVRMRPMKGTAPRGLGAHDDDEARTALLASPKDRAENVMIVDLVRSDLGRIARTGSVRVTALLELERFPRVWQLTSTVEAEVDPARPLGDLFAALFPAGSVTGAPKVRAMEIIRELEGEPREAYCGAVGVIQPGGDACFNVAIRTAWLTPDRAVARLHAGSAVTLDSTPAKELREVHDKLAAFTIPRIIPALFETIRLEHGVARRLGRHLARLGASARYFDIDFDACAARAELEEAARSHDRSDVARARMVLEPSGHRRLHVEPFASGNASDPRLVALATAPIRRHDVALYHKTTDRTTYDTARGAHLAMFDVLLWNEEGEATEFTRGNLVASINGALVTPALACGLLPGILRGELLDEGRLVERILPVAILATADALWFINALRGWVPVRLTPALGSG